MGKLRVKRVVFFCCHFEASGIPTKKIHDSLAHQKSHLPNVEITNKRNTWRENFQILDEEGWDMTQLFSLKLTCFTSKNEAGEESEFG